MVKPEKEVIPIICCFFDVNDRYGIKYKETFRNLIFGCFCCKGELSSHIMTCSDCNYGYNFCGKCYEDRELIVGLDTCIFCERQRNDKIMDILGIVNSERRFGDLYCRKMIDEYINYKKN